MSLSSLAIVTEQMRVESELLGAFEVSPEELIDIAVTNDLHFDAAAQEGVMFHLIGALPGYGKLGTVCIGRSRLRAERLYRRTEAALKREAAKRGGRRAD